MIQGSKKYCCHFHQEFSVSVFIAGLRSFAMMSLFATLHHRSHGCCAFTSKISPKCFRDKQISGLESEFNVFHRSHIQSKSSWNSVHVIHATLPSITTFVPYFASGTNQLFIQLQQCVRPSSSSLLIRPNKRNAHLPFHINHLTNWNALSRFQTSWALKSTVDPIASEIHVIEDRNLNGNFKVPAKFRPYPFSYHTELTVRVESLTNLGFGIARIQLENESFSPTFCDTIDNTDNTLEQDPLVEKTNDGKWVIFIPNVIPGELCRVRVYRNHASYSDADLLEILEPSPDRIEPRCSLATICGGCQYQHIHIDRQRQMKSRQVQELFERLGGLKPEDFPSVLKTLGTDDIFGYRSKITPHYEAPLKKRKHLDKEDKNVPVKPIEIGSIGFKEKASRRIVDVSFCHIATPSINTALVQIRNDIQNKAMNGKLKNPTRGATLLLRDAGEGVVETIHTAYVNTTVNGIMFRFQAGNFFQNNPFMLPKLVDHVVQAATKKSSTGKDMTHLIDCYCGSGLFALGSSSSFKVCVGIEVNDKAVQEARANAELNGIGNCDFVSASAEAIFESKDPIRVRLKGCNDGSRSEHGHDENHCLFVQDFPKDQTVVVIDPPRKGCSEEFLMQLEFYQPQRVVYMSCDPATQARDANFLVNHGFQIVSVQPFDLFPQTRHIECLAVFERKETSGGTCFNLSS